MSAPSWGRTTVIATIALVVGLLFGVAVGQGDSASGPTTAPTTTASAPTTTTTATTTPPETPWPDRADVGVPSDVVLQSLTEPGDGIVLRAGVLTVVDDGTTIDSRLIRGGLVIEAADVTITRTRIEGNRRLVVDCQGCERLVVEDVEIVGTGDLTQGCIGRTDYTLRRSEVIGCIDAAKANGRVLIEDSYLGELRRVGSSHNDGVQSTGGDDIVIRRNLIEHTTGGQTSDAKLSADQQPLTNVVVEDNRLIVSTCRALYVNVQGGKTWPAPTGRIAGNVVSGHTCADWLVLTPGPDLIVEGNVVVEG